MSLRVGYVPEHFSTPLTFAIKHHNATFTLKPFPAGTGHMVTALQNDEIDIGIGLTEGWVAGLAKAASENRTAGYKMIGTYVESPLCWALSTGSSRKDVAQETDPGEWPKGLRGKKLGVSRIGSGSYVMGFVLAKTLGWLSEKEAAQTPFDVVPLENFANLRRAVNDGTADFFMWEYFTSKRYYDNGEIRKIGEIYTPWPSWHIVGSDKVVEGDGTSLAKLFEAIDAGIEHFQQHKAEAIEHISTELDYSREDAEAWLPTCQFAKGVKGVQKSVVEQTLDVLKKAGVAKDGISDVDMIAIVRD